MNHKDLHDFRDVAQNYDLYLDIMYQDEDNHSGFWISILILPDNMAKTE